MVLDENKRVDALLPPLIKQITSMWVYTDIIKHSVVGDIQAPLLGYVPILSMFDEMGYWNFNPQYYLKVKEHSVSNITIKIYTDTEEEFPIVDGQVTCSLHFRRRPFLV